MKKPLLAALVLLCSPAFGQTPFSGPGVLSRGTGQVGQRSGQDVDLKYYASATGIFDTGLTPYKVTTEGTLVEPGALFGVEAGIGAYGRHAFRRSALGVDYAGNFRHYGNGSSYDGSNQQFGSEYTHEASRRLLFNFRGNAGTQSFGTAIGTIPGAANLVDSSTLLFDNRASYVQLGMTTNYALSSRTAISMGGERYTVDRQSSALIGTRGYTLQGSITHQLGRSTFVGVSYSHIHYDFPRAFGESDLNMYSGTWSREFGRNWSLSVNGGIFTSAVQGVQSTALDPAIAELLGIGSVSTIFYRENILPTGGASLQRRFRRSSLGFNYSRSVTPGNGVYLTSVQESYGGSYSYTGLRKIGFSINGGVTSMSSLGQSLAPFRQFYASANFTYNLGAGLQLGATYQRRHQNLQAPTFQQDSSRVSIGIFFTPGTVPISFH